MGFFKHGGQECTLESVSASVDVSRKTLNELHCNILVDSSGTFSNCSEILEPAYIVKPKDLSEDTKKIWSDLFPETREKSQRFGQAYVYILKNGGAVLGDITLIFPSGANLKNKRLINALSRQLGFIIDKSETEQKLISSKENFLSFFQAVDYMILIADDDGNIYFTNASAREKLVYARHELE